MKKIIKGIKKDTLILVLIICVVGGSWAYKRGWLPGTGYPEYMRVDLASTDRLAVKNGQKLGRHKQITLESYREGTLLLGDSAGALLHSPHYRDSVFLRSTRKLPATYTIRAVVGEIDFELEYVNSLSNDAEYAEGPKGENGCYLLAIVDQEPSGHYTNKWWHEHRKVAIDVDNNEWGKGMPHPIFMVAFDSGNEMQAYNGAKNAWSGAWDRAIQYRRGAWYTVEIMKTHEEYILSIYDVDEKLLEQGRVPIDATWHHNGPDYFVIGEPHENYYQGSMRIHSIEMLF